MKAPLHYAITGIICFFLKLWRQTADVDDLRFLLLPVDGLLVLITGSPSVWVEGAGYYHPVGNYLISAECAGFNFLIILFLTGMLLVPIGWRRWWVSGAILLLAWPLTVLANVSRVVGLQLLDRFVPAAWSVHTVFGSFVYLGLLLVFANFFRIISTPRTSPWA